MTEPRITTRARTCGGCGRTLSESGFYRRNSGQLGSRCKECVRKAGRARKSPCPDCGVLKWPGSERCRTCASKIRRTLGRCCADCGATVTPGSTRCLPCHNKNQDKGRSSERVKFNGSPEWAAARAECFARDAYTCQDCGARNAEGFGRTVVLHAHHVLSWSDFPERRLDLANLVTLCADCHKAFHSSLAVA